MRCGCRCSLLAKIKQQRDLSGRFFEVGVADLFWKIEGKKEAHSTRVPAPSSALHAVVVIPRAVKDFAGFMSHARPGRDRRRAFVSGILAPQRVSNLRIVTKP